MEVVQEVEEDTLFIKVAPKLLSWPLACFEMTLIVVVFMHWSGILQVSVKEYKRISSDVLMQL